MHMLRFLRHVGYCGLASFTHVCAAHLQGAVLTGPITHPHSSSASTSASFCHKERGTAVDVTMNIETTLMTVGLWFRRPSSVSERRCRQWCGKEVILELWDSCSTVLDYANQLVTFKAPQNCWRSVVWHNTCAYSLAVTVHGERRRPLMHRQMNLDDVADHLHGKCANCGMH